MKIIIMIVTVLLLACIYQLSNTHPYMAVFLAYLLGVFYSIVKDSVND